MKPQYIAPVVVYLCHESTIDNGGIYESAGGFVGKYRWSRSPGKAFTPPENLTVEAVRDSWSEITDMSAATMPASVHEQMSLLCNKLSGDEPVQKAAAVKVAPEDDPSIFNYTQDDVILYALGVGATTTDEDNLRFLYEGHEDFAPLPSFAVIPGMESVLVSETLMGALKPYNIEFDFAKMLHGEQYIEIFKPLPARGVLRSESKVVDVLDKGSGALLILEMSTYDQNNVKVCYNQFAMFLVGSGNFGGKKMSDKQQVKPIVEAPKRQPDVTVYEQTSLNQVRTR